MVNIGPLAAKIVSLVWGTPANFNGFRILAALLHGTLIVGVSHTLRRWTEGATYIRQCGHHAGPTFLVHRFINVGDMIVRCVSNSRLLCRFMHYLCHLMETSHCHQSLSFLVFKDEGLRPKSMLINNSFRKISETITMSMKFDPSAHQ